MSSLQDNKLLKKEKTYKVLDNIGVVLTTIGGPGLIGSLLSPFDIEGPVIEIATATLLVSGIVLKSISVSGLEKLKNNSQSKKDVVKINIDNKDKENLQSVLVSFNEKIEKQKTLKKK